MIVSGVDVGENRRIRHKCLEQFGFQSGSAPAIRESTAGSLYCFTEVKRGLPHILLGENEQARRTACTGDPES